MRLTRSSTCSGRGPDTLRVYCREARWLSEFSDQIGQMGLGFRRSAQQQRHAPDSLYHLRTGCLRYARKSDGPLGFWLVQPDLHQFMVTKRPVELGEERISHALVSDGNQWTQFVANCAQALGLAWSDGLVGGHGGICCE